MQHGENSNPDPQASNLGPASHSLIDSLSIIFKHRRIILRVTLAVTIITVICTLFLPNIYTAKALILPGQQDRGLMSTMLGQLGGFASLAGGVGAAIGGPTTTDLYVSMLKSEAVKDPIIDRFRLLEVYNSEYRTDVYKDLDKKVFISAGKKDGIITITVDDKDPKLAAAMANAYIEELGNLAVRMDVTGAGQNRSFLEERLEKAKAELLKAEENLKSFQGKYKAINVTAQAEATIKGVAELKAQLAAQEVQLAAYRRQFTDSSQEVKNLTTLVNNLRGQIAKLEGMGGNSAIPSVGSVPNIGQEYIRLMREFKIQESLVEILTKQFEMTMISEAKDISPIQIIQKAKIPERKSKPARKKLVIFFAMVTFFGAILVTLMAERLLVIKSEIGKRFGIGLMGKSGRT